MHFSIRDQQTEFRTPHKFAAFMTRKPTNRIVRKGIISGSRANAIATPEESVQGWFRAGAMLFAYACFTRLDLGYCPVWSARELPAPSRKDL
jgi:hypothetical protein